MRALLLMLTAAVLAAPVPLEDQVAEALKQQRADGRWRAPSLSQRTAAVQVGKLLGEGLPDCSEGLIEHAAQALQQVELELHVLSGADGQRALMVHDGAHRHGAGLLLLRCGPASPWLIQAPHSRYDLNTGALALQLMAESQARAGMWNTAHRYRSHAEESPDHEVHPADVTREPGSLFHAFTLGLALGAPELRVLQLHGFARDSSALEAIVSSGDPDSPERTLADALTPLLGITGAFGADTDQLGGTLNVQGQALRQLPGRRFLHLELSPAARERLTEDPKLRRAMMAVIQEESP